MKPTVVDFKYETLQYLPFCSWFTSFNIMISILKYKEVENGHNISPYLNSFNLPSSHHFQTPHLHAASIVPEGSSQSQLCFFVCCCWLFTIYIGIGEIYFILGFPLRQKPPVTVVASPSNLFNPQQKVARNA